MDPAQGKNGSRPGAGPAGASPERQRWIIIGSIVVIAVLVTVVSLPGLIVQSPAPEALPVTPPLTGMNPVPPAYGTTAVPVTPSPAPALPVTSPQATSPAPAGPPGFTVSITPAHATAGKGETVVYRMRIEAQNGFSGKIHMEVTASFLFFSQTQDLGFQEPPYPKTIEYPFTVPDTLPPGITVNGVVRSTGDGITREDHLSLTVR